MEIYSYDVGTGTTKLLSSFNTDSAGEGIVPLVLNSYYIYRVYDPSGVLKLVQGPELLTVTQRTLLVGGTRITTLGDWVTLYGINCTVQFYNSTKVVSSNWSQNGSLQSYCLNVYNLSNGFSLDSRQCSGNNSGNLQDFNLSVPYQYYAFPTGYDNVTNATYILYCNGQSPLTIDLRNDNLIFGSEGIFWSMILLLLITMMGVTLRGAEYITPVLIIVWMILTILFNLIPYTLSIFMGVMSMIVIWIFSLRKRQP